MRMGNKETDPNVIYDMKNFLDNFMIYNNTEINQFAKVFFKEKNVRAIWTWQN